MSDTGYREPLNKFLELGRPDTYDVQDWMDYVSAYNLTDEHIPDLLKMLEEHTQPIDNFDEDNPASWTAIHVWRALGQLKNEQAIQPMIDAMMRDVWEDWGWEDIPQAVVMFGEAGIERLKTELAQRADDYDKIPTLVHSALEHIGDALPELQDKISNIFIEQLEQAKTNDPSLNGFLILSLTEWKVEKALPIIEKAFESDDVDTMIMGDWDDVQIEFGLKTIDELDIAAKNAKRRVQMMREMGMDTLDLDDFGAASSSKSKSEKKKKKAKRKQAKKSKMQNRKKKKK